MGNLCIASSQSPSTSSSSSSAISTESSGVESESDSEVLPNDEQALQENDSTYALEELKTIYRMVIQNLEECATRFPEHYKSFYRLIYHFMNSPAGYCDLEICKQLLLGQYKTSLGNVVNGLFYERKNNNLFNGIWRIPSSEIDRPGSFSAHLVKCVEIFILFLSKTNNHKILIDIALNLYKTPDVDKRYIADAARKNLYQQCITYAVQILRDVLQKNLAERDDTETLNLLTDIYKIHKKCIKYMNQKEPTFTKLLVDVYKFFVQDKVEQVPDNCNLLDLAIKLCLQELSQRKAMEKSTNIDGPIYFSEYLPAETDSMITRTFNIPGVNTHLKHRTDLSKVVPQNCPLNDNNISHSVASTEINSLNSQQYLPIIRPFAVDIQMLQNETNDVTHFNEYDSNILEREKCTNILSNLNEPDINDSSISNTEYLRYPIFETNVLNSSPLMNVYDSKLQSKVKFPIRNRRGNFKPYCHSVLNDNVTSGNKTSCKKKESDYNDTNNSTKYAIIPINMLSPLPPMSCSDADVVQTSKVTMVKQNILENMPETATTTIYEVDDGSTTQSLAEVSSSHRNKHNCNVEGDSVPIKTLQQKLAERQKTNQMKELNLLSVSPVTASNDCEDIIILD